MCTKVIHYYTTLQKDIMNSDKYIKMFGQSVRNFLKNIDGAEEETPIEMNPALELLITDSIAFGRKEERTEIVAKIKNQICFDALADSDGRCEHHGGKCYELGLLISSLTKGDK